MWNHTDLAVSWHPGLWGWDTAWRDSVEHRARESWGPDTTDTVGKLLAP